MNILTVYCGGQAAKVPQPSLDNDDGVEINNHDFDAPILATKSPKELPICSSVIYKLLQPHPSHTSQPKQQLILYGQREEENIE